MQYIKLPIDFFGMLEGKSQQRCPVEESIAQYIMIQITTRYGEVTGRRDFGSDIWDLEFNQLIKMQDWERQVKDSLLKVLTTYETRLSNINVDVKLHEIELDIDTKKRVEVRKKAIIKVGGDMVETGIPFHFNTSLYVSPLSQ